MEKYDCLVIFIIGFTQYKQDYIGEIEGNISTRSSERNSSISYTNELEETWKQCRFESLRQS